MQKVKKQESRSNIGLNNRADRFPTPRVYFSKDLPKGAVPVKILTQRYVQEQSGGRYNRASILRHYIPGSHSLLIKSESRNIPPQALLAIRKILETKAVVEKPSIIPQGLLKTQTYPEELLSKYKALVRAGYVGDLSSEQENELNEVCEQIQSISRQDKETQETLRRVQETNDSLKALETRVEARIARRRAEHRGNLGETV